MGDLTKNLSRSEFACECGCGFDTADIELVLNILQDCVDHFSNISGSNVRIQITGPNRCVAHNEKVQKQYNPDYVPFSSKTQHMYGRAADFKLFIRANGVQIDPDLVAAYLEKKYPSRFGIGRYSNRTHADSRSNGPARWEVK